MSQESKPPKSISSLPGRQDESRYAALLAEAASIKGVSLWKDAKKRLRQNKVAMASFYFLILLAVLAIFTPMLPLQSPLLQDPVKRKLLSPSLDPIRLGEQKSLGFKNKSLVSELKVFDQKLADYITSLENKKPAKKSIKTTGSKKKIKSKEENIQDFIRANDPYQKLWTNPGFITKPQLSIRTAVFGDWCIPSIFGTDNLGRDLLARVFWGARVSLAAALVATMVSLIIGVSYGAISGYFGGLVDAIMMRIVDILYSVPFIFVVIFITTIISEKKTKAWLESFGFTEITVFFVLIGAIYWLTMARVVRGQIISLKNDQFVEAARTIGASKMRIVFVHLIPNVFGIVIVYLTLTIPSVMLFEAFLSFLGLGVKPPDVSWGILVDEGIKVITPVKTYAWLIVFPGLAFASTLFALNFLGDGLRDALDPKMKNR